MTRPATEREQVARLASLGFTASEIARRTGIPRSTVRDWSQHAARPRSTAASPCGDHGAHRPAGPWGDVFDLAYAYLLGLYLGDGALPRSRRGVWRLRVTLDTSYPVIIAECHAAMSLVLPDNRVGVQHRRDGCVEVGAYSKYWPCLLPQHGPGRKHERAIRLEPWQRQIVGRWPGRFVRGLIHSDGSRSLNTIRHPHRTYAYSRYEFSNRSDDIRALFVETCAMLGVEARPMGRWSVSVARRAGVAMLDRHVGPKR